MHDDDKAERGVVSKRAADIAVAVILIGVGALVMFDSLRIGAGWASDGPQSGYFPFYVGLLIVLSSLGTVALAVLGRGGGRGPFVERSQLRDVLKVFIPAAVFVGLIGVIGIYLAGALFIGVFMRWLGRFRWHSVVLVAVGVPLALFVVFEIWFLVPLPKGPVEGWLGY